MKRKFYTVIIFIITFSGTTLAQIPKGSIFLGGTLSLSTSKDKTFDTRQTNFYISPAFGIAIKENIILGGNIFLAINDGLGHNEYSKYGTGIFLRKYKPLGKGFYLFGDGNLTFSYETYEEAIVFNQTLEVYQNKNNSIGFGFNPGISYEVSNRLQIELTLLNLISGNYNWGEREALNNAIGLNRQTNGFAISSNLSTNGINSVGIGVRFLLKKPN